MFTSVPAAINYRDPWIDGIEDRLGRLASSSRRIAYFYENPDTSTFRYRAFNPGYTLAAARELAVSAAWFDNHDLAETSRFVELADALVVCRARYSAQLAALINRAIQRGIPVLFDCDDLVFDVDRLHLVVETLDLNQRDDAMWNDWFALVGRLGATLRMCDSFTTTNEYLAARAVEFKPGLRTGIIPNYLNRNQQDLSELCFRRKESSGWARDGRIHIGYFSGSPTHAKDFAIVARAIADIMNKDPRIVLRIVGFLDLSVELLPFKDRIEFFPLQDYMNLQRLIAEVEINIAPLRENTFTNCKSELKFFEAAICGTMTVATPTYAFSSSIDHGRTGFLAPAFEWTEVLQRAIDVVTSFDVYREMAYNAYSKAVKGYAWDVHAGTIVNTIFG